MDGQLGTHAPFVHATVPPFGTGQAWPQAPQSFTFEVVSTHCPWQAVRRPWQLWAHCPWEHTGWPPAVEGQTLPQLPQLSRSDDVSVHAPEQTCWPAPQQEWLPMLHTPLAHWGSPVQPLRQVSLLKSQ